MYTREMKPNLVKYGTLIIRSQVEYNRSAQEMILRYIVATPATGQQRGFTDIDVLLAAVRTELLAVQNQVIPPYQATGKA